MRRQSEQIRQLRGTARADRRRPAMRGAGVRMPAGLAGNKPAARAWRLIASELGDRLRPVDGLALQLLVLHFGAAVEAAEALAAEGPIAKDHNHGGIKKAPAAAIFTTNSDRAARLLVEFGCTPRSRAAVPEDDQAGPSLVDMLFAEVEAETR